MRRLPRSDSKPRREKQRHDLYGEALRQGTNGQGSCRPNLVYQIGFDGENDLCQKMVMLPVRAAGNAIALKALSAKEAGACRFASI
jgi:hypothetical protein